MYDHSQPLDLSTTWWFYRTHYARLLSYDSLYYALQECIDKGTVRQQTNGDLSVFCYTADCLFKHQWDFVSMTARGLVLDTKNKCVVATPMMKFFNYEQVHNFIKPSVSFKAYETMDGVLGIIYYYNNRWNVSTKGSFSTEYGAWAQEYLDSHINTAYLKVGHTYCAEIIAPVSRIVVDYQGKKALYLITGFDEHGKEYTDEELELCGLCCGFDIIDSYKDVTLDNCLDHANSLGEGHEGFVLKFSNGFRCKIKSDSYKQLAKIVKNVTPLNAWQIRRDCLDTDSITKQLPDEFYNEFTQLCNQMDTQFAYHLEQITNLAKQFSNKTPKEIGLFLNEDCGNVYGFPSVYKPFIFQVLRSDFEQQATHPSKVRNKIFELFKPKGNVV
ncbi:MAG: RNA ligase [Clostridia bacterium]|jgi:RNA ligase